MDPEFSQALDAATLRRETASLRALARQLVGDEQASEDLVQEAWQLGLQNSRPPRTLAWLRGTLRNLARRHQRDQSRRRRREQASAEEGFAVPAAELVAQAAMQRDLAQAVFELEEPYRQVLQLRFWHEEPPRRIASILGLPLATVKTRLQRALGQLRGRLDSRYGDRSVWSASLLSSLGMRLDGLGLQTPWFPQLIHLTLIMKTKKAILFLLLPLLLLGAWALAVILPGELDSSGGGLAAPAVSLAHEPENLAVDLPVLEEESSPSRFPVAGSGVETKADDDLMLILAQVVDAESGLPLPDARLEFMRPLEPGDAATLRRDFDKEGRLRWDLRYADREGFSMQMAQVSAPGHASWQHELPYVLLREGVMDLGRIALERGTAVSGRIFHADGRPLRQAALIFHLDDQFGGSFIRLFTASRLLGRSDLDGRFRLEERLPAPRAGAHSLVAITAEDMGWLRFSTGRGEEKLEDLRLILQPRAEIRVQVVDELGDPVAAAQVYALPQFMPLGMPAGWKMGGRARVPAFPELRNHFQGETDSQGIARFPFLTSTADMELGFWLGRSDEDPPPGYAVGASKSGWTSAWLQNIPSSAAAPVELRMVLRQLGAARVQGVVRDVQGRPMPGVRIEEFEAGLSTQSDELGRYQLEELRFTGDVAWLEARAKGFLPETVKVPMPIRGQKQVEVDVVLRRLAPIEGRVVDQEGQPVPGVFINCFQLEDGSGSYSDLPTDEAGRFRISECTAGPVYLLLEPPAPLHRWAAPWYSRASAGDRDLRIVLAREREAPAELEVDLFDLQSGDPLTASTAQLYRLPAGDQPRYIRPPACERPHGAVLATGLIPGPYVLHVQSTSGAMADLSFDVLPGQEKVEASLGLMAPGFLRGRLVAAEGQALPVGGLSGSLSLWDPQREIPDLELRRSEQRLIESAAFSWDAVPAGKSLLLRCVAPGWHGETLVQVQSGVETEVELVMRRSAGLLVDLAVGEVNGELRLRVRKADGPWSVLLDEILYPEIRRPISLPSGSYQWEAEFEPLIPGRIRNWSGEIRVKATAAVSIELR